MAGTYAKIDLSPFLDTVENTVALCPNCHKKMHVINSELDRAALKAKSLEGGEQLSMDNYMKERLRV